jgi:6-phosphogluconolactonase/glucosamine-6-phosphate isomerase/deaminase
VNKFVKVSGSDPVINYLCESISGSLDKGEKVLWLVAGGSAIGIAVAAAERLKNLKNVKLLTVTLTDERYGKPGHPDSNWQQLKDKRFELPGARLLPVLQGGDFEATAKSYAKMLNQELDAADYSVALAGMGPDGHIFGIKPGSPAVDSPADVVAYKWDDYQRLTPTFNLINRLDEVIVYAMGAEKHKQFEDLEKDIPAIEQPAQYLKKLNKVTIFNDYKGEAL